MRKLFVILISFILLMFCGCEKLHENYKSISIASGVIEVPNTWICSYTDDGLIYFYQQNKEDIVAFESKSFSDFKDDEQYSPGLVEANGLSDEFQSLYIISSNVISNGAIYGEELVNIENSNKKLKYLSFSDENITTKIYIDSDKVNEDGFMTIAKSFDFTGVEK